MNELVVPRVADDVTLEQTLERQVQQWPLGTVFDDVSVHVLSGTAVLVGYLTTPQKLSALVDVLARAPGVQQVVSQVEVLPDSPLDAQLRTTVADALRQVFGDLAAAHAAAIHIIVSDARVTLAGTVDSDQQRARAEEILRGIPGVVSVASRLSLSGSAPADCSTGLHAMLSGRRLAGASHGQSSDSPRASRRQFATHCTLSLTHRWQVLSHNLAPSTVHVLL